MAVEVREELPNSMAAYGCDAPRLRAEKSRAVGGNGGFSFTVFFAFEREREFVVALGFSNNNLRTFYVITLFKGCAWKPTTHQHATQPDNPTQINSNTIQVQPDTA